MLNNFETVNPFSQTMKIYQVEVKNYLHGLDQQSVGLFLTKFLKDDDDGDDGDHDGDGDDYLPSEEEHSLIQSSRSFSKEDWHSRRSFLS